MRVERFQENDMRTAMAKVRADLGGEAVIISSRRVAGRTEIMAAIDYDPDQLEEQMRKFTEAQPRRKISNTAPKVDTEKVWEIVDGTKTVAEPTLQDMQSELGKLRKLFEGELAQLAWRDEGKRQPNRLALISRLEVAGISRDIASKVVDKVLPCADLELGWRRVLRMLSRVIKVSKHSVLEEGGIIALVGSTGVGKTTTAAKIAAQYASKYGKNNVAFITTDNSKVGGQEQLISLGSTLGVPVQVVTSKAEMQNTLESLSERKLIIIDTAGVSQRDTSLLEKYQSLELANFKIHPYLVLSATSQESVINETIKAYSGLDITAAVITKTDENSAIGPVLSGLIRNKLATAFIGTGQRIPEDLELVNVEVFISNIIKSCSLVDKKTKPRSRRNSLGKNKLQQKKLAHV